MRLPKPPALFLSGPTASGKSALAVKLAKKLNGEIINADSVQLYKGFDIGSGKITEAEMAGVPHHLLGAFEPEAELDVHQFSKLAEAKIEEVAAIGKLPIIVGGSGLYIRTLLCGLVEIDDREKQVAKEKIDAALAERKAASPELSDTALLYEYLSELDPQSAEQLHANDTARIKRALLVALQTGESITTLREEHRNIKELSFEPLIVCQLPNRERLYEKINARTEKMFELGLVEEVRTLVERCPSAHALGSIGYRQVAAYLAGQSTEAEALQLIQRDTRRLAKRQYTWWKNQPQTLGWTELERFGFDCSANYDISEALDEAVEQFSTKLLGYLENINRDVPENENAVRGGPNSKLDTKPASVNRVIPYLFFEAGPF